MLKPVLKAPGTKRLKPNYDKLLSFFAFDSNLRPYIVNRRRVWAAPAKHAILVSVEFVASLGGGPTGRQVLRLEAAIDGAVGSAFHDHRVSGRALFPGAGLLQLAADAAVAAASSATALEPPRLALVGRCMLTREKETLPWV